MARRLDPREIYTLTFDCYGTLIDWRRGVADAAASIESLRAADLPRLVRDRERIEREIQRGRYLPYGEVLAESVAAAAREQGIDLAPDGARRFAESQARWPPFDESRAALARLAARWQLAILSNVEDRVLDASVALLEASFEERITAEQVRAYKPAHAHFETALARLGVEKERILHVASSWFHDVEPALALGIPVAFVDRDREGVPAGSAAPALVVAVVGSLARARGVTPA